MIGRAIVVWLAQPAVVAIVGGLRARLRAPRSGERTTHRRLCPLSS